MTTLLVLIALLLQPAPPAFAATWQSPGVARIVWQGAADLTCLYKGRTLIRCWAGLDDGPHVLVLGGRGPLDARAHPSAGDVFFLDQDGVVSRAPLLHALSLPLVRAGVVRRLLYLAMVRT